MTLSSNELSIASTITLIICAVIIGILLIRIFVRRRAQNLRKPAGPLDNINQHMFVTIKEEGEMARVRKRKIHWNASSSLGVIGYKLYWAVGEEVNYDSNFAEVGNVTEVMLPDDIPAFPLLAGDIALGVVAVDHIGNESDMAKLSAPFDFSAPDAPTGLIVETI